MARRKSDKPTPDSRNANKTKNISGRLEDDSALWARVAETAQPLANKNRFIDLEAPLDAPAPPAQAKTSSPVAAGAPSRSPTAAKPLRKLYSGQRGARRASLRARAPEGTCWGLKTY